MHNGDHVINISDNLNHPATVIDVTLVSAIVTPLCDWSTSHNSKIKFIKQKKAVPVLKGKTYKVLVIFDRIITVQQLVKK